MRTIGGKTVYVDDRPMAVLKELEGGVMEVTPLPACSIGTQLLIIIELREQGYTVV